MISLETKSRAESALQRRIVDYFDVDKMIEFIVYSSATNTFSGFSGAMTMYHQVSSKGFPKRYIAGTLLPTMQYLACNGLDDKLPQLPVNKTRRISIKKITVASTLARIFFGVYTDIELSEHSVGRFNLINIMKHGNMFALECILCYFAKISSILNERPLNGIIVITRNVLKNPPQWDKCNMKISKIKINNNQTLDEANEKICLYGVGNDIGKSVLENTDNTEESVLFFTHPELFAISLICGYFGSNDSLSIFGIEKYANAKYNNGNVVFGGGHDDIDRCLDDSVARNMVLVNTAQQHDFTEYTSGFHHDINVIFNGMNIAMPKNIVLDIAVGRLSERQCDSRLKFMQQLMAASAIGTNLHYYSWSRHDTSSDTLASMIAMMHHCERLTVAELYAKFMTLSEKISRDVANSYNDIDIDHIDIFKMMGLSQIQ